MRRAAILAVVLALLLPGGAEASPPPEVRWLVYITAPAGEFLGALHAVRTDGRRDHTLLDDGVLDADLGPRGSVYAVRASDEVPDSLVRLDVRGGAPEPEGSDPPGTTYLGVAASARGDVAFMRRVRQQQEVPRHLREAIPRLRRTGVPVLAPPRRPRGTTGVVTESTEDFYRLLFTNDPEGTRPHVEQVNRFVTGTLRREPPPAQATPAEVRGTQGSFFCGASTCFLQWRQQGASYTVGEFGSQREAVGFANALATMETLAGPGWRVRGPVQTPELVARDGAGAERVLQSVDGFCECSFRPTDWTSDGTRVLVVEGVEGATRLLEYPAEGGEPTTAAEATEGVITDAAYGPEGILVLESGEATPEGILRTLDGQTIAEEVVAFDASGRFLAYVGSNGTVTLQDLETGEERSVAEGAVDVSLAPAALRVRPPDPPPPSDPSPGEGFPLLSALLGAAVAALIVGAFALRAARRRR